MKRSLRAGAAGFTLVEMMVASGVAAVVFAALMYGALALQRTYAAVDVIGSARSDQMRVLDFISRDVRRAQSVSVTASPPTLTVVVQSYIDPVTGLPRPPAIVSGAISYGSTSTIVYSLSGTNLIRQEAGTRMVLGSSISGFVPTLDPADTTNKTVNVQVKFAASLKWQNNPANRTTFTTQAKAMARR